MSGWAAPTAVLAQKDVFHGGRPFVRSDRLLEPLWNALGIRKPNVKDCVDVLSEVAEAGAYPDEDGVLIDIYRELDRLLTNAERAERGMAAETPLCCRDFVTCTSHLYGRFIFRWLAALPGLVLLVMYPPCALDRLAVPFAVLSSDYSFRGKLP